MMSYSGSDTTWAVVSARTGHDSTVAWLSIRKTGKDRRRQYGSNLVMSATP
ncbi:hypothetical protein [Paraburkholderia azotifigens]|uniref:Uncharacterized protein n=1 Tax=Paraburkholderia azotifigens TaxID=2057004 RepID=A0ABU9QYF8_9BURK|nr:hypothetical protein [Paraburkholderia azotifigens]